MTLITIFAVTTLLALSISTPATAQAPDFVNLTDLLTVSGPFHTFLNYLVQTQVIQTLQKQANNTEQGVTIFVPKDSAFSAIKNQAFSNLTEDQLKSLLLLHALPKHYSLAEFRNLSNVGPVSTFAGRQYIMNVTDDYGMIQLASGWTNTKITLSLYSIYPVAVYEVDHVLLPKAIFAVNPLLAPAAAPLLAPASAPTPEATPVADTPSTSKWKSGSTQIFGVLHELRFFAYGRWLELLGFVH